jgi:hypothetical protein
MWRRYNIVRFGKQSAWENSDIERIGEICVDPALIGKHYPGAYTGPMPRANKFNLFTSEAYLEAVDPQ